MRYKKNDITNPEFCPFLSMVLPSSSPSGATVPFSLSLHQPLSITEVSGCHSLQSSGTIMKSHLRNRMGPLPVGGVLVTQQVKAQNEFSGG